MRKLFRNLGIIGLTVVILIPNLTAYAQTFTDLDPNHKYTEAVQYIAEKEIIHGYPDGTYKPANILNRAELLKIIIRSSYEDYHFEPYFSESCFTDVPANEWHTGFVCFAKAQGFVEGYSDGTFRPGDQINLVEALSISLKIFQYESPETDPWYKGLVDTASAHNFIPLDFNNFDQKINRGQMAELITRILKYKEENLDDYLGENKNSVITYDTLNNNNENFDPLSGENKPDLPPEVILNVPFTSQAPFGQWTVPYNEACEEASLIMVEYFLRRETLTSEIAKQEILNLVTLETEIGYGVDIGIEQVKDIAFKYFGRQSRIYSDDEVTIENIKHLIANGYAILTPVAANYLKNPNYKAPYHMIVIVGYDEENFYAHDPGTYKGSKYPYPQELLVNNIHDWAGSKSNVLEGRKAILVIEKPL